MKTAFIILLSIFFLSVVAQEKQESKTLLDVFVELCMEEINNEQSVKFCHEGCLGCDYDTNNNTPFCWEKCERCKDKLADKQESCASALESCFYMIYGHCMRLKISLK